MIGLVYILHKYPKGSGIMDITDTMERWKVGFESAKSCCCGLSPPYRSECLITRKGQLFGSRDWPINGNQVKPINYWARKRNLGNVCSKLKIIKYPNYKNKYVVRTYLLRNKLIFNHFLLMGAGWLNCSLEVEKTVAGAESFNLINTNWLRPYVKAILFKANGESLPIFLRYVVCDSLV